MTYIPASSQLRGLPYEAAECYGKPHIMCRYSGSSAKSHMRDEDARCVCCGRMATNAHHNPPLSKGHIFLLMTKWGRFALKPSLIAVCGSGTTGCHNGFHGGARFKARWVWDSDEYAEMWWNGEFLKHMRPHSRELYRYGCWHISDSETGREFDWRDAS